MIHMLTFATQRFFDRWQASMEAKSAYASYWQYNNIILTDNDIDCSNFREVRWLGDYRYCKLEAVKVAIDAVERDHPVKEGVRHYIFWHDADTFIMEPQVPLHSFVEKAGHAPFVLTDSDLSVNNGAFFLEVSNAGKEWFSHWRRVCASDEWPWADNGCMFEAMLQWIAADRYKGGCKKKWSSPEFNSRRPEPPTGMSLARCFQTQLVKLGHPCCGSEVRKLDGISLLTGLQDSFNHHSCEKLASTAGLTEKEKSRIGEHCFRQGMFMLHGKEIEHGEISKILVEEFIAKSKSRDEM